MTARNSGLLALRDMFNESPEEAVEACSGTDNGILLLSSLIDTPVRHVSWPHLIRLAEAISVGDGPWFRRLVQLAIRTLEQDELIGALMDYGTSEAEDDLEFPNLEREVANGTFDAVIVGLSKQRIADLARGPLAKPVVTACSAGRIARFVGNGDLKRAVDELMESATTIELWRPTEFDRWVERVWEAHRKQGCVVELTEDRKDWRNCTMKKTIWYGQLHGGNTSKGNKPQLHSTEVNVPHIPVWGVYTEKLQNEHPSSSNWGPLQRAEYSQGWIGQWVRREYFPVSRVGAMLRDVIWYWHAKEKERKVREFCAANGLQMPTAT